MNRRSVIQILVGAIAAIAGLATLSYLRQNRCVDAGGEWASDTRSCAGPSGPIAVEQTTDLVVAIAVAAMVGWTLYRISTFANRRKPGPA